MADPSPRPDCSRYRTPVVLGDEAAAAAAVASMVDDQRTARLTPVKQRDFIAAATAGSGREFVAAARANRSDGGRSRRIGRPGVLLVQMLWQQ